MRIRAIGSVLLVGLLAVLMVGCKKAPLNRSVEQYWQLVEFTTLADGNTVQCDRLFFGITREVTMVSEKQGTNGYGAYVALTEYREDESLLVLKDFKVYGDKSKVKEATSEQLKPFGIVNPKETVFHIVHSSHKRLVLESDYARLELKKF